jgi:DNA-binding LacI/PurR family transcriptional regulator/DNA-binding transcriptional regulator YhcF (GntR family)
MNLVKQGPAVQKAYDFVRDNLDRAVWQAGERLPSTLRLAQGADVSPVTMLKALSLLKSQDFISGLQRSRFRAGGSVKGTAPWAAPDPEAWILKRTALEKDILAGVYAHQRVLPSIKELKNRYGTGFRTMRKILRSLVQDNVVKLRNKNFELQRVPDQTFSQRIVFITFQIQAIPRSALNQGQYQVLGLSERECIHRGLKLEIAIADFYNSIETRRMISGSVINDPALGYILDLWWYPGEDFRRAHIDLLTRLAALKKPVAILDEIGDFVLPQPFASNPLFQVFCIEGKKAGARVARLLLGMGHQSVAYVSAQHINAYSKQRLEGVLDQYGKAGRKDGVWPIVSDPKEHHLLHLLDLSGFDEPLIRKVLGVARTKSQALALWKEYRLFRESGNPEFLKPKDIRLLQTDFAGIRELAKPDLSKEAFEKTCLAAITHASSRLAGLSLVPLFEAALKCKEVTAWICVSDGTALAALDFLRNRNTAVPGRISLVGFDNEPVDAVEQRLTSFDFNAPGFIYGMLNFIVRPPKPRGPYLHTPIEVEGIIMQRDTTAPRWYNSK